MSGHHFDNSRLPACCSLFPVHRLVRPSNGRRTRRLPIYVLLALIACAACRSDSHPEAADDQAESHHAPDIESAEHGESNLLTIDGDVLRDLRLTSAAAELRASGEGVTALGELQVNEDAYAEVRSSVPARVTKLLAGIGDRIESGQPLLELNSVEVGKAVADYKRQQAHVLLAQQGLERKRGLARERILPERELQEATADAAAATAELAAAEASLHALGISPADAATSNSELTLRAPISGTVIDRTVVQGQMVEPSDTLMRVGDLTTLWLIAHVFERDAVRVAAGTTTKITFPALPGRSYSGSVLLVGQQVDASSRTVPVRIAVRNDGELRAGMSASVWLPLDEGGAHLVAIPTAALQRCDRGWCVFVPRDRTTFEVRPVGRGRDFGGEVEILTGLAAGETVVVDGAFLLKAERERARGEGEHHDH